MTDYPTIRMPYAAPDFAAIAAKALAGCLVEVHAAQKAIYRLDIEGTSEEAVRETAGCIGKLRMARKLVEEALETATAIAKRAAADCDEP